MSLKTINAHFLCKYKFADYYVITVHASFTLCAHFHSQYIPVSLLARFIQNPSIGEGGFSCLFRLLLVLMHGAFVDIAEQI